MAFGVLPLAPTLYVFVQDGCEACAAAEPHMRRLARENPTKFLLIQLHVNRKNWVIGGWSPKATPGYALTFGGKVVKKHIGALDYKQLREFMKEVVHG